MIDEATARDIEQREANLETWIVANGYRSKSGWSSYPTGTAPEDCKVSNEERAQLEVRRFMLEKPDKYFLYINEEKRTASTWMSAYVLGSVTFGREWRDNFGGRRVPVTIHAVNGITYHGTYYRSSGDYARVKAAKRKAA